MELRNSPVQARSVDRLATILDAARQVLQEVGRDRLTTGMVAEAAGCSIGTLYRYFPDRVAVLDAIAPDRDLAQQKLDTIRDALPESLDADIALLELFDSIGLGAGDYYEAQSRLVALGRLVRAAFVPVLSAEELAKVHAFGLDVAEVAS